MNMLAALCRGLEVVAEIGCGGGARTTFFMMSSYRTGSEGFESSFFGSGVGVWIASGEGRSPEVEALSFARERLVFELFAWL